MSKHVLFLLLMFSASACAYAQAYTYKEVMVPSGEEGTRLCTRIYLPEGEGPFPTVVTRTPYVWGKGDYIPEGRQYAEAGFAYVQQDCRGKGGSEGKFLPNVNERADGLKLYQWLQGEEWCREIGIFGSSYTALTGWIVGDSLPSKVKGMYLSHYGVDRHISCFRAGLFREDIMSGWLIDNAEEDIRRPERGKGADIGKGYYPFYLYRPHVEADVQVLGQRLDYYRDWITHTDYTDPYWNTGVWADLKNASRKVSVPMTIVAGQFDHHEEGTILGYERLSDEVRKRSRLILGAWNHSFQVTPTHTPHAHAMDFDIRKDMFDWFTALLMRHEEPQAEVRVYDIEADRWENFSGWPMPLKREKKLYLAGGEKGLTLRKRPSKEGACVCYDYDPEHPVMAEGGETLFTSAAIRGCHPMSSPDSLPDVWCFISEPLKEDLKIGGQIRLRLSIRTDVDDTSFAFTLGEVTASDTCYNMRTSITTLGYREGLLLPRTTYEPGTKVEIEIVALPLLWTVRKGNRLRLDVKSSQFPEYAVHPNYAGVWAEQADTRIAHQEIFLSGDSYLVLPIVK